MSVPQIRIRQANSASARAAGDYVVYWMTAFRRTRCNFALERAVEWSVDLCKPLVIVEALRVDYPWASHRFHRFILDGMLDNARGLANTPIGYYPYVEPAAGAGKGMLEAIAQQACVVITDDYPAFFIPRAIEAAGMRLAVVLEAVDSNGLLPLRAAASTFASAYAFRRYLQKALPEHLFDIPVSDPLENAVIPPMRVTPAGVEARWPRADLTTLSLGAMPIRHDIAPTRERGGSFAGDSALGTFVQRGLSSYADGRTDLIAPATSGLSPYLHFGFVSVHEVFARIAAAEGWSPDHLGERAHGKRTGWWGMSVNAEAFLDQLVTWRELGFNECVFNPDYDRYESLPDWALSTLGRHASDTRPVLYTRRQLEEAETHDALWNAAQLQLVREGRIHNYLRMLWGKKILEWTPDPREALDAMVDLNNKYALDGRDPNSYSGIFWCLGRYDRPWPERPVFGKVRYMSSASTARKLDVAPYIERYEHFPQEKDGV